MNRQIPLIRLLLSLIIAYSLTWISFSNEKEFWYFYTFTILFLMSIAYFYTKIKDEVKTIRYILLGISFGMLLYAIIAFGYKIIHILPILSTTSIDHFITKFAPSTISEYLLLLILIAPGEELFWRGYIQQQLKRWFKPSYSVVISAALFSLSLVFSGFWLGVLGSFVVGIILGYLYEWKKSMQLIILAHITMLVLLFLVFPL
ncbi:CPBP family intramembrane glutamic endopeptidase [Psychrobacillus sp. L3]|uniref:CPBP family intramembrane glutamic endopeptidase n=1 Tax=Psychrobacillus sp. L3 TaxID=3236891 RepID=UPI0036F1BD4D